MNACILFVLIAAIVAPTAPPAVRQAGEEDGTRAAFIKQRPPARTTRQRPPRRQPKASPTPVATNGAPKSHVVPVAHAEPVGLGFSLFEVLDKTRARRVDPSGTFRAGDMLRFVLESSIDGYLYIFVITHEKDGAKRPVMIFPDARLYDGDNFVYAHTATEVPSRRHPAFDVFRISGSAGVEQVYFVVSRDPLPGVPIGDELVRLCEGSPKSCPWSPLGAIWEPLERQASAEARVSVRKETGKEVTRAEDEAIATRDLILGSTDDEPSVIAVSTSADTPMLVRAVSIRHE